MAQTALYSNANFINNHQPQHPENSNQDADRDPNRNNNCNTNQNGSVQNIQSNRHAMKNEHEKETKLFVSYHDQANGQFGCKHYARNCYLRAACCDQWYVCRFCHDETNEDATNRNEYRPHQINRYATKYVKCMQCGTEQPASQYCSRCIVNIDVNVDKARCDAVQNDSDDNDSPMNDEDAYTAIKEEKQEHVKAEANDHDDAQPLAAESVKCARYAFGRYYCDVCKFYDNAANKKIFHCADCGLCRLGKRKDYVHCPRCECCLHYKYYVKHPCIENSLKSDCPICFTYLFQSREPVTFFMPCGHPIHYDCLMQYVKVGNWKCPICRAAWCDVSNQDEQASQSLPPPQMSNIDGNGAIVVVDVAQQDSNHNHHHYQPHPNDDQNAQNVQPENEPQ